MLYRDFPYKQELWCYIGIFPTSNHKKLHTYVCVIYKAAPKHDTFLRGETHQPPDCKWWIPWWLFVVTQVCSYELVLSSVHLFKKSTTSISKQLRHPYKNEPSHNKHLHKPLTFLSFFFFIYIYTNTQTLTVSLNFSTTLTSPTFFFLLF